MDKQELLTRIVMDSEVVVGKPRVRGTRLPVYYILKLLASGVTYEEVLAEYHGLAKEDILACLLFAAEALEDTSWIPLTASAK